MSKKRQFRILIRLEKKQTINSKDRLKPIRNIKIDKLKLMLYIRTLSDSKLNKNLSV